tara:strand:+ start:255 stop:371 length:117 start_codon:yes stop_codon:yes gene_type:complete
MITPRKSQYKYTEKDITLAKKAVLSLRRLVEKIRKRKG